jgi:ATP-binding cassette, subfamily B, bacterial
MDLLRRFRRVPYIPQMEMVECGAASLAMVMAYHGRFVPLAEVRQECGVSRDGASALGIVTAAHANGFEAAGVRANPEDLSHLPLPAILHWEFNHFVVLEHAGPASARLVDPATGPRIVSHDQLRKSFTGVALTFEPGPGFVPRRRERPTIDRYVALVRQSLPNIAQLFVTALMLEIVALVVPVSMQLMIDKIIIPRQDTWLTALGFAFAASILVKCGLTIVRSRVVQYLQASFDIQLTTGFMQHLLELPLGFFHQRAPGDLLQRLKSNAEIRDFLSSASVTALLDVLLLAGYSVLMVLYDFHLGLLVLGLGLVRLLVLMAARSNANRVLAAQFAAAGGDSAALVEMFSMFEMVKGSGAEATMLNRWSDRRVETVNHISEYRLVVSNVTQFMTVIDGISMAVVLWVGGRAVIEGSMTLGVFAAFLTLQSLFTQPLQATLQAVTQLQVIGKHLERLDDVLATAAEETGTGDPGLLSGAIEFDQVSYRYSPTTSFIIEDVSFEIGRGELVALVGPTGSGKSTIAQLIAGMVHPECGEVRLDGRNLRGLDVRGVRRQMGVVLQEIALFDDTVRANIALHDRNLPFEKVRQAARLACIDDVIEALPRGYDTRIGENGHTLSGGQRQRLALARALAADPAILILDEATRSQDAEIETHVTENLGRLGCTRIVIAHRLATIRRARRILVVNRGRIVQQGTFEELAVADGLFRRLLHGQPATESHSRLLAP